MHYFCKLSTPSFVQDQKQTHLDPVNVIAKALNDFIENIH
jgi:hypothetical protein